MTRKLRARSTRNRNSSRGKRIVITLALSAVAAIGSSAAPAGPTKEAQAQVRGEKEVWAFLFDLCLSSCGGPGDECCGRSVQA